MVKHYINRCHYRYGGSINSKVVLSVLAVVAVIVVSIALFDSRDDTDPGTGDATSYDFYVSDTGTGTYVDGTAIKVDGVIVVIASYHVTGVDAGGVSFTLDDSPGCRFISNSDDVHSMSFLDDSQRVEVGYNSDVEVDGFITIKFECVSDTPKVKLTIGSGSKIVDGVLMTDVVTKELWIA